MVDKNYNLKNTPANYPLPFTRGDWGQMARGQDAQIDLSRN